jgi:gluconokinase
MASNKPLTDEDRWEWLKTCLEAAMKELYDNAEAKCVFLSCSALKKAYRDMMRIPTLKRKIDIHFVYMKVEEEVLMERIGRRKDHYMKSGMVKSQLEALEEPGPAETDAVTVDAGRELGQVVEKVLKFVRRLVGDH